MNKVFKILSAIVFCFSAFSGTGQSDSLMSPNALLALLKADESRIALEEDKPQLSLRLMQEAAQIEPSNIIYSFEVGQLQYILKNYSQSIATLQPLIQHPDATPQLYQILGNAYFMANNRLAAKEVFDIGLSRYPKSGILFLEKGNLANIEGEVGQALFNYLKGIEVDPNYPLNYYKAAYIYFDQAEVINGLVLGETFMNLDKTSPFHEQMGMRLFEQYRKCIQLSPKGQLATHFCNPNVEDDFIKLEEFNIHPPRCIAYSTMVKNISMAGVSDFDLISLTELRLQILNQYLNPKIYNYWQDDILDFQKIIVDNNHFNAYNQWLFRAAQPDQFIAWRESHSSDWIAFCEWYNRFQLEFPEP